MAQAADDQWDRVSKSMGRILARTWTDSSFKQRLLEQPAAVLADYGVEIPAGVEVLAVENTPERFYLLIPPPPAEEISEDELLSVAGGGTVGTAGTAGSLSTVFCPISTAGTALCAGSAGTS